MGRRPRGVPRILLLTKQDRFSRLAHEIARGELGEILVCEGQIGDPEPPMLSSHTPDVLISFLSPWIVRKATLDRCGVAINFHPGSADYPGTGCYNFALYEEAAEFGTVCHHMLPNVDTGAIIMERRFSVPPDATVESLKLLTMETMIDMFRDIVSGIAAGEPLPASGIQWSRRPFTRREMEALKVCCHSMPDAEVARRVRASVYPGYPGPVLHRADGTQYRFPVPPPPALA